MKFISRAALILSCMLLFCPLAISAQRKHQTEFDMESQIDNPKPIPKTILSQLISKAPSDDYKLDVKDFEGTFIYLNKDARPEFLVINRRGANVCRYWLFRKVNGKWTIILESITKWLSISKKFSSGFRNIEIAAASAVTLWETTYKFNGVRYTPRICSEQPIGEDAKRKFFTCADSEKPYR